jgi:hypothetical protein
MKVILQDFAPSRSTFTLTIGTGNAAFRLDDGSLDIDAIGGILIQTADRISGFTANPGDVHELLIRDINGNQIGSAIIEEA